MQSHLRYIEKMRLKMKKLTFLAASLLLAGCGDNANIQQVKDMVTLNDNTITVGNALDHRSVCEKVKWETVHDERNRDIVRYTCIISPKTANKFIENNINKLKQQMFSYIEKQTSFFNDENKHAQLSRFYLQNAERGLKELSDSGIPLAYNQLKDSLLKYLRDNYKTKEIKDIHSGVKDFELPRRYFKGYTVQQSITQLKYNGYPVSPMEKIDLSQDAYLNETIQQLISMEQQAINILSGNNTGLDVNNDKGEKCNSFDEKFPCNTKRSINQAFDNLFFKNMSYDEAVLDIQKQISRYEQIREAMDKRDTNYIVLKEHIQQYLSKLNQQSQLKQLEQVVDFSIIRNQKPTIAACNFILTLMDSNTVSYDYQFCFDMAYEAEWNDHFDNIIQSYYKKYVEPDTKTYLQHIDKEEKALQRIE